MAMAMAMALVGAVGHSLANARARLSPGKGGLYLLLWAFGAK